MFSEKAVLLLFFSRWPASLFADQVVLKNGDRLSGAIEKSDDRPWSSRLNLPVR